MRTVLIAALILFSAAPSIAEAPPKKATIPPLTANWAIIPAQSSIGFSATHAGKKLNGTFRKWTAAIRFDPAKLDEANATVRIDLGSAFTGDKTYDKSLPEADWFNIKSTPVATFQSQKFRAVAPGKYIADGILTLRNIKMPLSLPFALTIAGDTASMAGDVSIKRMAFALGAESDAKGDWVSLDIPVAIKVVAKRLK